MLEEKKYLQITSGRGPVECCRAVVLVMQQVLKDAESFNISVKIVEHEDFRGHETECMLSCVLELSGHSDALSAFFNQWSDGTVLWVSTSNRFRPNHKRKNWFVGINVFAPLKTTDFDERQIEYETMRASGPGGQNVNKVETAVRATYKPLNISVTASDERSQSRNKALAHERLLMRLSQIEEEKKKNQTFEVWMNHNALERGNPYKRFKGAL